MKLKILLLDIDSPWFNLPLMKISSYHKSEGDHVYLMRLKSFNYASFGKPTNLEIKSPLMKFDKVYISCIFTRNRQKALSISKMFEMLGMEVEIGGSGISLEKKLPDEIEHQMPDYSLYNLDFSIGFLTRGCIRNCPWCIVPKKEGKIKLHSPLDEFLFPRHRKVLLLDNNLLAYPKHKDLLLELIYRRLEVCFNQGLDIRLIDDENAKLLSLIRYRDDKFKNPRLYFSWDLLEIERQVFDGIEILKNRGVSPNKLLFYVLCGFNVRKEEYTWKYFLDHDWYRYEKLASMDVKPFIMKYNRRRDIPLLNAFARWVNRFQKAQKKTLTKMESFKTFCEYKYKRRFWKE